MSLNDRSNEDDLPPSQWPTGFGVDTTIPPGPIASVDMPAIGEIVQHPRFGPGTITEHSSSNGEPVVTVDFGKGGIKQLLLRYAALSQVAHSGSKFNALDVEAYDAEVKDELHKLKVRKAAQVLLKAENEPPAPPFDAGTLREILARPPEPAMRVEGLIPWDAAALIVAARKTGKTSLVLNLSRSLLTGEDFLGSFGVRPIDGIVAILNYEVSAGMLGRWADDHDIDQDRFYQVNLRGRRNPLGHPEDRAILAADLRARGVESLICDPFGKAYNGKSQNDPGEVGAWLADLDLFARSEVGAKDVILTAHAGWNGERTRGSSALEDWADTIVTMTRDAEDESLRFLRAMGRDVEVDEDRVDFDPATRTLSMSGTGSRRKGKDDRKLADLAVLAVRAAREQPGIGVADMEKSIRSMDDAPTFRHGDVSKAAKRAAEMGHLTLVGGGPGKRTGHFITPLAGIQT